MYFVHTESNIITMENVLVNCSKYWLNYYCELNERHQTDGGDDEDKGRITGSKAKITNLCIFFHVFSKIRTCPSL